MIFGVIKQIYHGREGSSQSWYICFKHHFISKRPTNIVLFENFFIQQESCLIFRRKLKKNEESDGLTYTYNNTSNQSGLNYIHIYIFIKPGKSKIHLKTCTLYLHFDAKNVLLKCVTGIISLRFSHLKANQWLGGIFEGWRLGFYLKLQIYL